MTVETEQNLKALKIGLETKIKHETNNGWFTSFIILRTIEFLSNMFAYKNS